MNDEELIAKLRAAQFSDDEIKEYLARKNRSLKEEIHGGAASVLQGASLGLGGLIDPEMKRASEQFNKEHSVLGPVTNIAGSLVGALATPGSLASTAARRTILGGGVGAVSAATPDGTLEQRAKRAAVGGAAGAAAGLTLPFLVGKAGQVVSRLIQPFRNPSKIVAEATGPLLPDNAEALMARQERLAPGTAIPAGMDPDLPRSTRVIGANPTVAREAVAASKLRSEKIQSGLDQLSDAYKQLLGKRRAPLDLGNGVSVRKAIVANGVYPSGGNDISLEEVQALRNVLEGKLKALRLSVRKTGKGGADLHRIGEQKKALTQWLETVEPNIRGLDKDYRVLSDARRTEDVVVKNLKQSRGSYSSSRAAGIEPGSPGASLPTRGGLFHTLLHPDRPKLAEAANELLLQPGAIPQALLDARARAARVPQDLRGLLPYLMGSSAGQGAGLLFDPE